MRLYGSAISPFVRKTRIVLGELGLEDRVAFTPLEGSPLDDPGLRAKNPLKKIPFLEMADGAIVFDSRVVIEAFLEAASEPAALAMLPASGPARLEALTRQALGDGICDAAVSVAYEMRLRPEAQQWPHWMDLQFAKASAGVDWFETNAPPEGRFDLGDAALAAVLPYLDLRFADRDWRAGRPRLAAWWETAKTRPSVAATFG